MRGFMMYNRGIRDSHRRRLREDFLVCRTQINEKDIS